MSANTLKDRMKDFAEGKSGTVSVSGADLAAAASGAGQAGGGPVKGTVKADVPQEAKDDAFAGADATAALHQGLVPSYLQEQVEITQEDRDAFLQCLVTGGRYEREFSLFNGKLTGVFRCRKIAESDGILAWLNNLIMTGKIAARIEHMSLMRNALLAAQVKSLRGLLNEDYEELPAPYAPVRKPVVRRDENGKDVPDVDVEEPGWLRAAAEWGKRPEALVSAIHGELQLFERRYWTMVMEAGNQNFWSPAAST